MMVEQPTDGFSPGSTGPARQAGGSRARIDRYEIVRSIGRGGQGEVFLAWQTDPRGKVREAALKILRRDASSDPAQVDRFLHEANILASLDHPNIVKLWERGESNGEYYYAMQYIEGVTLDEYVRDTRPTVHQQLAIFRQLAEAVSYLHQQAVIHRDLKSGNIRVNTEGRPFIIDFGLAKQAGVSVDPYGWRMGTPRDMAPEQTFGDPHLIDVRTDVYALGFILYRMLTGSCPYPVESPFDHEVVFRHIRETPPDVGKLTRAGVDRQAQDIVLRCLAKGREQRYQSAADILADLRRYAHLEPLDRATRRRPVGPLARLAGKAARNRALASIIALVVVSAAAIGLAWLETRPSIPAAGTLADRVFTPWFEVTARLATPHHWFENVMVIAMDEESKLRIPALAKEHQCPDVSADTIVSWRQLHGAMMRRLAPAEPRAVVWDYYFDAETPYDRDFIAGVEALQGRGAKVVVAAAELQEDGSPQISPPIRERVDAWGLIWAQPRQNEAPDVSLVAKVLPGVVVPAIGLATFALLQHPDCGFGIDWDDDAECVLRYRRSGELDSSGISWLAPVDRITLTETHGFPILAGSAWLPARMGYFRLELPDQPALDEHTVSYQAVFDADDETLRRWFHGKVLVVGNAWRSMPEPDWHAVGPRYRDGGVFGVYLVGETIGALLKAHYVRRASPLHRAGWCVVLALGGLLLGARFPGRTSRLRRYAGAVAVTASCVAGAAGAYVAWRYLCTPAPMIVALWLAVAAGSWVVAAGHTLNCRQTILSGTMTTRRGGR